MKELFDACKHQWTFQANAENNFAKGVSFFRCKECHQIITLQEKCSLEQTEALKESLKIQERNTFVTMISVVIAAFALVL